MSYASIATAAQNPALDARIAACVAQQTTSGHPINLVAVDGLAWRCAAEPGWGEAVESAMVTGADPDTWGADQGVISDAMILAAVQRHLQIGPS